MALRLWVEIAGADDVDLYVGVEKWRGKRYIPFEGSYGFGRDRITSGWQKASLRELDAARSRSFESATLFRAGERLQLVVAGRWLWPTNLLTGQFPAAYEKGPRGRCTVHWGPNQDAHLLVPVIPRRSSR